MFSVQSNLKFGIDRLSFFKRVCINQISLRQFTHSKQGPLNVFITGSTGQISYSFLPLLLTGQCFGNKKINLKLLGRPESEGKLKGIQLELQDSAFPLLESFEYGFDPYKIFKDADVGIFLGGQTVTDKMKRKDLLPINGKLYSEQGKALNEVAKKTCKSVVVANPTNTNCLILAESAPTIPKQNFTALTRLDQNRALSQIALKAGCSILDIKNLIVWGNHSDTMYPDVHHGTINGKKIKEIITDNEYLEKAFIKKIYRRGYEVLLARKSTAVFSSANAIKDHLHNWYFGTRSGEYVSMAVHSDGSYGIPTGLIYSFPVTCSNFSYKIVQGLPIDKFSQSKLDAATKELLTEKQDGNI